MPKMGRPGAGLPRQNVTMALPSDVIAIVDSVASEQGMTRTEYTIRALVRQPEVTAALQRKVAAAIGPWKAQLEALGEWIAQPRKAAEETREPAVQAPHAGSDYWDGPHSVPCAEDDHQACGWTECRCPCHG